jgi:hypothetical protein
MIIHLNFVENARRVESRRKPYRYSVNTEFAIVLKINVAKNGICKPEYLVHFQNHGRSDMAQP